MGLCSEVVQDEKGTQVPQLKSACDMLENVKQGLALDSPARLSAASGQGAQIWEAAGFHEEGLVKFVDDLISAVSSMRLRAGNKLVQRLGKDVQELSRRLSGLPADISHEEALYRKHMVVESRKLADDLLPSLRTGLDAVHQLPATETERAGEILQQASVLKASTEFHLFLYASIVLFRSPQMADRSGAAKKKVKTSLKGALIKCLAVDFESCGGCRPASSERILREMCREVTRLRPASLALVGGSFSCLVRREIVRVGGG